VEQNDKKERYISVKLNGTKSISVLVLMGKNEEEVGKSSHTCG
jgi:hypothetical protein